MARYLNPSPSSRLEQELEDGGQEAGDAGAGVGDEADAGRDLDDDVVQVDADGQLSAQAEGELDDNVANGGDDAEAGLEVHTDDDKDI